jgi:FKBP-type peptidyl-prolyl cis-trans isomerase
MKHQKGNTSVIVSFIAIVCLIGLIIYALMNRGKEISPVEDVAYSTEKDGVTTSQPLAQENSLTPKKSMEQTQVATNGDTLVMNYTGRLTDGTVFDSNVDPRFGHVQPFSFVLGAGQVIKGWDEGLVGMKVGEKKTLTIPPEKGYGARGAGNAIPPNATLIFDVELVTIK